MGYDKYVELKNNYLDVVVLIKGGNFYYSFDDDGVILNYLFGYKINNNNRVGFPVSSLDKVINKLNKYKINYYIDYNKCLKSYDENKYKEILDKGTEVIELRNDIDDIYNYLSSNIERKYIKKIISEIKRVIDEG